MKFILLISLQIMVVFGEQQVRLISECLTGVAAELPKDPKPIACLKPNEVYVCAYGEARCDGLLYCGTPPCHWGCYCAAGFKRLGQNCVKYCPEVAIKNPVLVF